MGPEQNDLILHVNDIFKNILFFRLIVWKLGKQKVRHATV